MGVVLPAIVGVLAVPVLLENLGAGRLGIFSLALGLIGFSSLFDLGLGRALTQAVAKMQGQGAGLLDITALWRKTLPVVIFLGIFWCGLLWLLAPKLVQVLTALATELGSETLISIRWLAFGLPVLLLSASCFGLLEGLQQFALVNLVRVPLNLLSFLLPVLVSFFSQDVSFSVGSLVLVRLLGLVWLLFILARALPIFSCSVGDSQIAPDIWRFGGWLTVSNLISPVMVHGDRFYLAGFFPPAAVALYTAPLDVVMRATVVPSAVMNAVFPALASQWGNVEYAKSVIKGTLKWMMLVWVFGALIVACLLDWLLLLWLGGGYAIQVEAIVRWLVLGVMVNGFSHIPFALLHAAGRADVTAKLHVLEFPVYVALLCFFVEEFSVLGAAIAWVFRAFLDMFFLYFSAYGLFPFLRSLILRGFALIIFSVFLLSALIFYI